MGEIKAFFIDSVHGNMGELTKDDPRPNEKCDIEFKQIAWDARSRIMPQKRTLPNCDRRAIATIPAHETQLPFDIKILHSYNGKESLFKDIIGADMTNLLKRYEEDKNIMDREVRAARTKQKIADSRTDEEFEKRLKHSALVKKKKFGRLGVEEDVEW